MGYMKKGSIPSLAAGVGLGAGLIGAGYAIQTVNVWLTGSPQNLDRTSLTCRVSIRTATALRARCLE